MPLVHQILEPLAYADGLELQRRRVDDLLAGLQAETIFLLEHHPVYTIGRQRDQSSLRNPAALPHPVHETNRGGQATYHGPGQLVGYPVLDLNRRGRDLHEHLRRIEEALIRGCAEIGVPARRRDGLTGVWAGDRKLASIGVGVRKWISMHGFAINITRAPLIAFQSITPCGLEGVTMTSLESEAGRVITMDEARDVFARALEACFGSV